MTVNEYEVSFWGGENVQVVMDAQHCEYSENHLIAHFKSVSFMDM